MTTTAQQVIGTTRASWSARPVAKMLPVYFFWLQRPLFVCGGQV